MESALLYSFSTISQTLATAFALLAAMVLYRFQTLENGLPKDLEALTNAIGDGTPKIELLRKLQHRGDYGKFKALFDELIIPRQARENVKDAVGSLGNDITARYEHVSSTVLATRELRRRLFRSLHITLATIAFSTIVIPFSHLLATYCASLGVVILTVGVAMCVMCLFNYVWLIRSMFLESSD